EELGIAEHGEHNIGGGVVHELQLSVHGANANAYDPGVPPRSSDRSQLATGKHPAPATLPSPGLSGLEPSWSRLIVTPELDGVGRTWHVLDNGVADPAVTLLCVHGNPTW